MLMALSRMGTKKLRKKINLKPFDFFESNEIHTLGKIKTLLVFIVLVL